MKQMVEHALDYARRGWPVFPCDQQKQPLVPRDKDKNGTPIPRTGGLYKATTNEKTIRQWWGQWPDAMIGFPCGPASGVWGIDPDVPKKLGDKDGLAYWRELASKHGGAPATHSHVTPSGGLHMLFRWREDKPISNKEGKLKGTGINVRGNGGYMIAPPSRRADGNAYQVAEPLDFFAFAEAPDWLYDLILPPEEREAPRAIDTRSISERARAAVRPPPGYVPDDGQNFENYVHAAVEGERSKVASAGSGTRNNELNTSAFNLGTLVGAGMLSEQDAGDVLMEAAWSNGLIADDGERSVVATISSGLNAGKQHPRQMPARDGFQDFTHNLLKKSEAIYAGMEHIGSASTGREDPQPAPDEPPAQGAPKASFKAPPPPQIKATPFVWRDPREIPTRQWLYARHYIRKFVSTTVAPGGVGKTSLTITEALAMASGRPLIGPHPSGQLNVWLWNGEDPEEELERRVMATALHYELVPEDLAGRFFMDSGRDMEIVIAETTRSETVIMRPVVDAVIATIKEHSLDVLIIDPFVSSHRVSENDNNAIDMVAKQWAKIANVMGCSIELVHHVRKTAPGQEITVEDGRGASALLAAARSARVLNTMNEGQAAQFGLESHKGYFRVGVGKANLAPPPDRDDWFHMASVDLGNGPLGLPGTGDQIGVVTVWTPPDPMAGVSVNDLEKAQAACKGQRWRDNDQASDWIGFPISRALELDIGSGKNKEMSRLQLVNKGKVKNMLRTWLQTGAFVRVEGFDERRKLKTFVEVGDAD